MTANGGTVPKPTPLAGSASTGGRAATASRPRRGRNRFTGVRFTGRPALYLLASLTVSLLAASGAPTPLYAIYQQRWGFTPVTTTVIFGAYAIAVLVSLLFLGKLSDHVGRRPVLLAALAIQVVSLLVFVSATGTGDLLAARVIQGVSTGAAIAAIGAGMVDVDRERGTLLNALVPGLGTGTGALASALAVRYLPAPTTLIYLILLGVIAVQAAGVALMRETVTRAPGALASLKPEIAVPRSQPAALFAAAAVVFAVWSMAGLNGALGPALVRALTGSPSIVLGGVNVALMTVPSVAAVYVLRNAPARAVMLSGIAAVVAGSALILAALAAGSAAALFAGTAVTGFGFGSGFQGGIRTVVPQAEPHQRAGVLSLLFVISYLGMGVPGIAAGYGVTHGLGLIGAAQGYAIALIVLALIALAGLYRTRPASRPAARGPAAHAAAEPADGTRRRPA